MTEAKRDTENSVDAKTSFCSVDRRLFLQGAAASGLVGAASLALPNWASGAAAAEDLSAIHKEIEKRHDESVQRLQEWIKQPSIAAENRSREIFGRVDFRGHAIRQAHAKFSFKTREQLHTFETAEAEVAVQERGGCEHRQRALAA